MHHLIRRMILQLERVLLVVQHLCTRKVVKVSFIVEEQGRFVYLPAVLFRKPRRAPPPRRRALAGGGTERMRPHERHLELRLRLESSI